MTSKFVVYCDELRGEKKQRWRPCIKYVQFLYLFFRLVNADKGIAAWGSCVRSE